MYKDTNRKTKDRFPSPFLNIAAMQGVDCSCELMLEVKLLGWRYPQEVGLRTKSYRDEQARRRSRMSGEIAFEYDTVMIHR